MWCWRRLPGVSDAYGCPSAGAAVAPSGSPGTDGVGSPGAAAPPGNGGSGGSACGNGGTGTPPGVGAGAVAGAGGSGERQPGAGADDSGGGYGGGGSSTRIVQMKPVTAKTAIAPRTKPTSPAPITTPVEWRRPGAATMTGAGGGAAAGLAETWCSARARLLVSSEVIWLPTSVGWSVPRIDPDASDRT